jgi:hypothetical protein
MSVQRRHCILALAAFPLWTRAHHGWSSFDAERPIYLAGTVRKVRWQNPHAELELELPADLSVPGDLAQRTIPAQTAPVDGKALLAKAVVPRRRDRLWQVELAPLTRMQAWQIAEIKPGAAVSLVGFTLREEKGDAVLRAEFLFVDGKAYALRSGPA